jgi:uncharacterized cupin superfamily protein
MPEARTMRVRVIKPGDVTWEEAAVYPEEHDPPGKEYTAAKSLDEKFSFGLWQRDVQRRYFERPYHEIAYIIEGQVEVTEDDGTVTIAGPGDILVTPLGSKGFWKNLTPVKKVWGIYEEPSDEMEAYKGPGAF